MRAKREKEIRLDQTQKVFKAIAGILKDGSCSYRYLIYDILGFGPEAYVDLMDGLYITNAVVDYETLKEDYARLERDYQMAELTIEKLVKQPYIYGIRLNSWFTPEDLKKGFECNGNEEDDF